MAQLINLPGGQQASFPDDMAPEQIEKVLQSHFQTPAQPQPNALQRAADIVEPINAAGGGLATGLVKAGRAFGGLVTNPLPQPIQTPLRAAGRAIADALTPSPDSISGQAMQAYPKTAMAGNIAGQVAPYAIPGVGLATGGNMVLAALAGAAQTDDGFLKRLTGAATGVATAGALQLAGNAVQAGVSALRSSNLIQQATKYVADKVDEMAQTLKGTPREVGAQSVANVFNVTKSVDDELFNTFRASTTNVAPQIRAVQRSIEDMLDSLGPNMSGPQKQALQTALGKFNNTQSLADLHDLRKFLAKNSKSFLPQDGDVFASAYKTIRNTVDDQMKLAAEKSGVLKEYLNANAHYKEKMLPLINAGSDDVANALSEQGRMVDPANTAKVLDTWIDKNIKPNTPNETKAFLSTLDPVGRDAVETRLLEKTMEKVNMASNPSATFRKEFQRYGATSKLILSPKNQKMMDGIIRVLDEASPITDTFKGRGGVIDEALKFGPQTLAKLMDNPPGQFILQVLGEPSLPKEVIKEFIKKSGAMFGGEVVNAMTRGDDNAY